MARKDDVDPGALGALIERVLPGGRPRFERMATGVSTQVYRIRHGDTIMYLRLAEDADASLAPEAQVHRLLREQGVRVPEVVHFEPFDAGLRRSVLITTEIPGASVAEAGRAGADLLREAGRDLAIVNSLPVDGFGWVRRDLPAGTALAAEHARHGDFVHEHLEADLALLSPAVLDADEAALVRELAVSFEVDRAVLAHGDFDLTHIFQHEGQYSGIIDFGEIRGAEQFYDLGHFSLHDGELLPERVLPFVLEGYHEVVPLPPDHLWRIRRSSLLIGVRTLARVMSRPAGAYRRFLAGAVRREIAWLRQSGNCG